MASDVNLDFHNARLQQISSNGQVEQSYTQMLKSGQLRNLGKGRFLITSGPDRGETVRGSLITKENGEQIVSLTPEHGLDMSTGKAALYHASEMPAWHSLGAHIPGGITDVDEVMRLGGIDFLVEKRPRTYRNPVTGEQCIAEGKFDTFRMDTGALLGQVGGAYEVFQNWQSFKFLQELVDRDQVIWESAGALLGGARTFVCIRLPESIIIDEGGLNDEIIPFVVCINSHDKSSKFEVVVTPWRILCRNTERFALINAIARWGARHTPKLGFRVEEAQFHLGETVKYFKQFKVEEQKLLTVKMSTDELLKVLDEVVGKVDEDATKIAKTRRTDLTNALLPIWEFESEQLGQNAYAAERTWTRYLDHVREVKPRTVKTLREDLAMARATQVLEGTTDAKKTAFHKQLLLRTR